MTTYPTTVRNCAVCDLRPRVGRTALCAECAARVTRTDRALKSEEQAHKLAAALTCPGCYAKDCDAVWNAPGYGWVCDACGPTDEEMRR